MKPEECKADMVVVNPQGPPHVGFVRELSFVTDMDGGLVPSALVEWYYPTPDSWVAVSQLESNEKPFTMPERTGPILLLDPTGERDGDILTPTEKE